MTNDILHFQQNCKMDSMNFLNVTSSEEYKRQQDSTIKKKMGYMKEENITVVLCFTTICRALTEKLR